MIGTEIHQSDPLFQKYLLTICGKYDQQTVSNCQPHWGLPQLPRPACPTVTAFLGSLHLVMDSLRSSACSRALFRLAKVLPGMTITQLLSLPNPASITSIYRYRSLIITLYPQTPSLSVLWRTQLATTPTLLNVNIEKSKEAGSEATICEQCSEGNT